MRGNRILWESQSHEYKSCIIKKKINKLLPWKTTENQTTKQQLWTYIQKTVKQWITVLTNRNQVTMKNSNRSFSNCVHERMFSRCLYQVTLLPTLQFFSHSHINIHCSCITWLSRILAVMTHFWMSKHHRTVTGWHHCKVFGINLNIWMQIQHKSLTLIILWTASI